MLVDSQVHVWRAIPGHPNPAVTITSPASDIPLELYNQYMSEYGIERAVLVQPVYPGQDNTYVAECASSDPSKFKAVCVVDPRLPGAVRRLEYWVAKRGCVGLRLRPRIADEALCFGDSSTFPLWEKAQTLRVVVSILASPSQFRTIGMLAARFPLVPIVIDHMGHPDVRPGVESADLKDLLALSQHNKIYAKVSGYYYFSRCSYPFEDCWNVFRALYDAFGPERLVWGSDFPHVLLKIGFRRNLLLQERIYSYLSQSELALIMGNNAEELYWPSG